MHKKKIYDICNTVNVISPLVQSVYSPAPHIVYYAAFLATPIRQTVSSLALFHTYLWLCNSEI